MGLSLVTVAALGAASAQASPLIPPGFQLPASHGYRIFGLFFDGTPHEERDEVILIVARKDSTVTYFGPAVADETSVSADLGALGSLDLHFAPAGRPKSERTPCGEPKRVKVERGAYQGSFDFRGEEGFARAHSMRASATAKVLLGLVCPGDTSVEGVGGNAPGAQLTIHRRSAGTSTQFVARTNSPTRPVYLEALREEKRGRIGISREVRSTAAPSAFEFDFSEHTALLGPGAPFHGAAAYEGQRGRFQRVHGDLNVDFPGHAGVHLLGLGTSAGMVRYVDNPSHPFSLPVADALRVPRLGAWLSTKP
ncbi:MAG TPA: hypothetical protein VMS11_02930 [Solirubrobacterales bacterium]|nr:hypothetical protein [Solirubrobacterales bacterium]